MKLAAWRLVVVAALFVCWLGYLGYLVATRPQNDGRPLVLSRPQLLVSQVDVVARVDADDPTKPVTVKEVLYPVGGNSLRVGQEILIDNLNQCRPRPRESEPNPPPDWAGPGDYLLPLNVSKEGGKERYVVTPTPASPGYPTPYEVRPGPPRIYPATAQALAQYRQVRERKP